MSNPDSWKTRYQDLVRQQDVSHKERDDIDALLCRTIIRVTLAANGLDKNLDSHLKSIRDAVRGGVTTGLQARLDRLSDAMMHATETTAHQETGDHPLCRRLIARAGVDGKAAEELADLCGQMLSTSITLEEADLDRLLALIRAGSVVESHGVAPGFFNRLIDKVKPSRQDEENRIHPNDVVGMLLKEMAWPSIWELEINKFQQQLSQTQEDNWVSVVHELAQLISDALGTVEGDLRDTESFLAQLTERLMELDGHLHSASAERLDSLKNYTDLGHVVREEVDGIESSVREAKDISRLRQAISKHLNTIQQRMQQHLTEEQARVSQAEQKESGMRARLEQVEREAHDLRRQTMEVYYNALRDTVTDLPNRAAYEERLVQEYARWKRFREPVILMVWDIDDFKSINDRFGHQAGDKALRAIAKALHNRLRQTDFIARYGGEEFVALLMGSSLASARSVAEEMRQAVESAGFHTGKQLVKVTISCGFTEFREGDTQEQVFSRADKALYQAKGQGKNRCIAV